MKKILIFITMLLFQNCSFDKKSGIWKNTTVEIDKKDKNFKDFESVIEENKNYLDKTIIIDPNIQLFLTSKIKPKNWTDLYFKKNNNFANFSYTNKNQLAFQSGKISRKELDKNILFKDNFLILFDIKGNIFIYSVDKRKLLHKYNFYKKKYKKTKKKLNVVLNDNYLYISDNLGYLYSYNFITNRIIWAKQFNAPFRSNLKIDNRKLFLSDENNNLFIIETQNGKIIKKVPTEEVIVKNNFISNISINEKDIFFLNTFGSLYSINKENIRMNWFLNLNQSFNVNFDNLFYSSEIKSIKNNLVILTNNVLTVLDNKNGSTKYKIPIKSHLSPLVNNDLIFIVSENNYLILVEISTGKIIYSYEITELIADYLESKKKNINIKLLRIINDQIFIFLNNSYVIKFKINGRIQEIFKLPKKLNSNPIFINDAMIYLSSSNKLVFLD